MVLMRSWCPGEILLRKWPKAESRSWLLLREQSKAGIWDLIPKVRDLRPRSEIRDLGSETLELRPKAEIWEDRKSVV